MIAIHGEVRINMYTLPSNALLPLVPLVRQNALTPNQWRYITTTMRGVTPAPSQAVIYSDSDDESTCTSNEWDIEKGCF